MTIADNTQQPLPDNTVEITAQEYDSIYEQVVRPDRAVYLPGYFRRWLKVTGPDLAWMYIAYRQAAYNAGSRKDSASSRFSGDVIANLCGTSERTYWNRLGNPTTWQKLNGLVKIIDTGKEWDSKSATPKQLPRRYTVAMTLPLTPADAASLRKWISGNTESLGGPEAALRAAIETPLDELIPLDAVPAEGEKPVTIRALARELFKDQLDVKLLDSLASAIQNHIMPSSDLIVIPLFFLENILPHLGAGPAWMLTILRDMCYADSRTGESRNRVTVQGGYAEIAGWLGMTRPLTIYEWLHGKKGNEPILPIYVREVIKDEKQLDFAGQPRAFDVLTDDIPRELLEIAVTNPNYAKFSLAFTRFAQPDYAKFSLGFTRFSVLDYATFSQAFTRFADSVYATCIVKALKLLSTSSLTLKTTTTTLSGEPENATGAPIAETSETDVPAPEAKSQKMAAAVDSDFWKLEDLFAINNVNAKVQKTMREVRATPQAFVAHLLYAFGKQSRTIQYPLNFALKELQSKPASGPDEKFFALACLPKPVLIAMLSGESAEDHPLASTWRKLMGAEGSKAPRYRELLPILLGDAAPTPEELRERKRQTQYAVSAEEHHGVPNPFPRPAWMPPSKPQPRRRF
ncbi:MAG: hypothetical protein HYR70_04185 [Chloroflexi bacterium]|nr:hypothetical protein [Chloroflexota bacterium]MBI3340755.1 hypothetical protein [Chloroflexota bacterium]